MKKRIVALFTAIAISAVTLAGCGSASATSGSSSQKASSTQTKDDSSDKNDSSKDITVNVGDQAAFFLFKVADQEGFFKDEFSKDGVNVKVENFAKMGPAIIEAMGANNVDLSIVGTFPTITAINNGNKIKILASGNYTEDGFRLVVGPNSDVTKVEDLEGKKIGVPIGTAENQVLSQILQKHGIDQKVELVNLQQADALTALLKGEIDGALFNSGTLDSADKAGCKVIATNKEVGPIVNVVIGREEFIKKNPEITSRFLKVLDKTAKWIDKNPDQAVKDAAAVNGSDEESVKVSLESRGRKISIDDEYLADPVNATLEFAKGQGLIDKNLSYDDVVDTSYFKNADIKD